MALEVPSFQIIELEGDRRQITLRGRAKPYPGIEFPSETRSKLTWYPGNPVATQQVLGPEYGPTTIEGMWKTRFLAGANDVAVVGFNEITSAAELVAAFEELRAASNKLRVQWGPNIRFGILKKFTPGWVTLYDVKWTALFEWNGARESTPRAASVPQEQAPVRSAALKFEDALVSRPNGILSNPLADLELSAGEFRISLGIFFDGSRGVDGVAGIPMPDVIKAITASESVRSRAWDVETTLIDRPYTVMQSSDRVIDVLRCENWRRDTAYSTDRLRAQVQIRGQALKELAAPGALTIITMPGEATLRSLAVTYYGTADAWQLIADVNGFDGSIVPAGTPVIIPPPSTQR